MAEVSVGSVYKRNHCDVATTNTRSSRFSYPAIHVATAAEVVTSSELAEYESSKARARGE